MKILVFIEHDIVVRHFIHRGVFRPRVAKREVLFIFPEEGHKRVTTDIAALDLGAPFIRLAVDQDRRKLWKRLFQVNHLRRRRGDLRRGLQSQPGQQRPTKQQSMKQHAA